jgi:hypothetical protein
MMRRVAVLCLGLLTIVTVAAAQPPPAPPPPPPPPVLEPEAAVPGTGAISGVVVDGATGLPLAGAYVQLTSTDQSASAFVFRPRQTTDSRGRYVFTHLPASQTYVLSASRPGYLDGGYKRLPGTTSPTRIGLAEGQWFSTGDIALWKPASISGVVRDERGEPLVGTPVRVLMRVRLAGVDQWAAGPAVATDDTGAYRISGLQPGAYVVHVPNIQVTLPSGEIALYTAPPRQGVAGASAPNSTTQPPDIVRGPDGRGLLVGHFASTTPDGTGTAYKMAFHPAAETITTAEVIELTHADSRMAIDVSVRPVPTVTVSGRVLGPTNALAGLPIRLVPAGHEALGPAGEAALTRTDVSGAFTFSHVPAGDYVVIASRSQSGLQLQGAVFGAGREMPRAADLYQNGFNNTQLGGMPGVTFHTRRAPGGDATGSVQVSVANQAVTGLSIHLTPGVTVSGHFEWDGSETPPSGFPGPPLVNLEPVDASPAMSSYITPMFGSTRNENPSRMEFILPNVLPGRYVIGQVRASTWTLAGAAWNGRDVMATALEVTGERDVTGVVVKLMKNPSRIRGQVRSATGEPPPDAMVVSFPVTPAEWLVQGTSAQRFKNVSLGTDGTYSLEAVVPGDYYIAAIPIADRTRWIDPDYLAALTSQATRVKVTPGATTTQDLRFGGGGR